MRFFALVFWYIIGLSVLVSAEPRLTPEQRRLQIDSFEYVWKTVRDKHWDPTMSGVDWQAVHDELRPQIERADTHTRARRVISAMLDRLHRTHFGIIPAEVYAAMDSGAASALDGATGIDLRVIDAQVLVVSVAKDSPAEKAGVRAGWLITRINGDRVAPLLRKIQAPFKNSTQKDLMSAQALLGKLSGKIGDTVTVECLDAAHRRVRLALPYAARRGDKVRFGNLPDQYVWFESRKISGDIRYIRFNLFLDPMRLITLFGAAVEWGMKGKGIVLDLRGNSGGIANLVIGMAGWFVDKPDQRLGTLVLRDRTTPFVVQPRAEAYAGPLAILVDSHSASTAEILAAGLRDLQRARLFGTRTAGAALPSTIERLSNGDGFQYAVANYIPAVGQALEGTGVLPDEEIPWERAALLQGKDPALDRAVEWILRPAKPAAP